MNRYNDTNSGTTSAPAPLTPDLLWENTTGLTTWSSPAIADGKVFIGSTGTAVGDFMYAFDMDTGRRIWRTPTDNAVSGGYGVTSSPAYANGMVFFGADRIYALDANTGAILWRVNPGNINWGDGSPTVWGSMLFIGGSNRRLYAIDQFSGSVIWTFQTLSSGSNNFGLYSSPAIWGGYVYLAACDGYVYQINITQVTPIATYYHRFNVGAPMYGSPLIYGGMVFIGGGYYTTTTINNKFYALRASDLSMVWRFPATNTPASFFSSAAVHNDTIFTGSIEGNLYALNPWTGAERWRWGIGQTWSAPGIASGRLFIGNKAGNVYSFDASPVLPPGPNWVYPTGGEVSSSPAIADGRMCVGTNGGGGRVICLGRSAGPVDQPPSVQTWEPGGSPGQAFTAGTPVDVRWTATDDFPMPPNNINISFGMGMSWTDIVRNTQNDGIHTWDTTGVTPGTYYVQVSAFDSGGLFSNDQGNFTFEILATPDNPPTVQVWEPGGTPGQTYSAGQLVQVRWIAWDDFPMPPNNINIAYGMGTTWTNIVSNTQNDGVHTWDTTGVSAGTYYVNVSAFDSAGAEGYDLGNFTFQITVSPDNPPSVIAWEPGGTSGQSYTVGQFVQVRWLAVDDHPMPSNNINISYGSGGTWTDVVRNTANDGTHSWDTTMVTPGAYYINVSVYDSIGQQSWGLGNFTFQIRPVNEPPTVTVVQPSGGESFSGGASVGIVWTMSDPTTPVTNLVVYLNYTSSVGNGQIVGPLTGLSSPSSYPWTAPSINALDVVIVIEVIDTDGGKGTDSSAQFEIDSTRPIVNSVQPLNGVSGVPLNTNVQATWNEGMNRSATEASFTLYENATWTPVAGSISWVGNSFVFNPTALLNPDSWYTANFTTMAKDDSWPGNSLLSLYSWHFMTSSVSDITPPTISGAQADPDPQEVHFSVNISALVGDDLDVGVVSANVTGPSGDSNTSMSLDGSSGLYYFEATYHQIGLHSFVIWAADTSDNWNSSSGTFMIVDTTSPLIQHTSSGPIRIGRVLNVTATITDNYMLQNVRLNYSDVTGTSYNVTMSSAGGDVYYFEVPPQSNPGTITYTIFARDTSNNGVTTQAYTVTVLENRPLPPQNLTVSQEGLKALRLNWEAPTRNEDGSPLTDLAGYMVYRMSQPNGSRQPLNTALIVGTTYLDNQGLADYTTYYYVIVAVNSRSVASIDSNVAYGTTPRPTEPGSPWVEWGLAIVIAVIIVVVIVASMIFFLVIKKREKEEQDANLAAPRPGADAEHPLEEKKQP